MCNHQFVEDYTNGTIVCLSCGFVQDECGFFVNDTLMDEKRYSSSSFYNENPHVRDEIYEIVCRMNGGDVSTILIEQAMKKLSSLAVEGSEDIKMIMRKFKISGNVEKAILTVILHGTFTQNNRHIHSLEDVAYFTGASMNNVYRVEKMLGLGRDYSFADVTAFDIIIENTLGDLNERWKSSIKEMCAIACTSAFCDPITLVYGCALSISKAVREIIKSARKNNVIPPKMVIDHDTIKRNLEHISVKSLKCKMGISAGSGRRAQKHLISENDVKVKELAKQLIEFKTKRVNTHNIRNNNDNSRK